MNWSSKHKTACKLLQTGQFLQAERVERMHREGMDWQFGSMSMSASTIPRTVINDSPSHPISSDLQITLRKKAIIMGLCGITVGQGTTVPFIPVHQMGGNCTWDDAWTHGVFVVKTAQLVL